MPEGIVLNVNIPDLKKDEIKGIKVCRQAQGNWIEDFDKGVSPQGEDYYWLTGVFEDGKADEDSDLWALANNFVSVVPIQFDLTAHQFLGELKNRGIESEKS